MPASHPLPTLVSVTLACDDRQACRGTEKTDNHSNHHRVPKRLYQNLERRASLVSTALFRRHEPFQLLEPVQHDDDRVGVVDRRFPI